MTNTDLLFTLIAFLFLIAAFLYWGLRTVTVSMAILIDKVDDLETNRHPQIPDFLINAHTNILNSIRVRHAYENRNIPKLIDAFNNLDKRSQCVFVDFLETAEEYEILSILTNAK